MTFTRLPGIVSVTALGLLLSASPALAQHRSSGGGSRGATTRSAPARQTSSGSRSFSAAQRVVSAPQRVVSTPQFSSRVAVPRSSVVGPNYRLGYRPFSQPYYTFRPRFSLGIGLFVGYPVAYPYYAYGYPYGYPYDPYYGYPPPADYGTYSGYSTPAPDPGYVSAAPGGSAGSAAAIGGVSLDINPAGAAVFLDGVYVGVVSDFAPTQQPLSLPAGKHRLELRAQGFAPLAFDLTIEAGQVTPFQGAMQIK